MWGGLAGVGAAVAVAQLSGGETSWSERRAMPCGTGLGGGKAAGMETFHLCAI